MLPLPLLAFGLLSLALLISGVSWTSALLLVILVFGLVLKTVWTHQPTAGPLTTRLVALILAVQFLALLARPELVLVGLEAFLPTFRLGIGIAAGLTLTYAGEWRPHWRFPVLLLLYCLLGVGVILHFPKPPVDFWIFQQEGVRHLLHGENPYAAEYRHPYAHDAFYSPETVKDGKVQSCPYPPLSLLLAIPGYLLGDIRWSLLAATAGTALLAVRLGRQRGLPPGHAAELVAIAFLFTPAGFHVVELGWTEPFVALLAATTLLALGRPGRAVVPSLGGLLAIKQYGFLWLPALCRHLSWQDLLLAVLAAGLINLPFFLWDPRAFWFGVVEFQFLQPFRDDALSIPAGLAAGTGYRLSSAVGLLAAGLVAGLVSWRSSLDLAKAPLGASAIFLALVLFNKQAFLNYYWLVLAFLMLAIVVLASEGWQPAQDRGNEKPRTENRE